MTELKHGETLESGWLKGKKVSMARKAGRCDYLHSDAQRKYDHTIEPGDLYVYGDPNESAGGFGMDRYCLHCVRLSYTPHPPELPYGYAHLEDYPKEVLDVWKEAIWQRTNKDT